MKRRRARAKQLAAAAAPAPLSTTVGPYLPEGYGNYGFYDAVNYTANRATRPFFATDSRYTLTSWSRLRALTLARWAYINVPCVKGAVDLAARLTVGTGFSPHTHTADKGLGKAADAYYAEKTRNIGYANGESMDELLLHDCRCSDIDGDLGHVLTSDEFDQPKLQLIEGHRLKNGDVSDPRCIDGVWVDDYGRRVAYNVLLPGDDEKTRRVEARDFIYLAERNRPDELRSMTALIHALNPLQDLYEMLGFAMQSAKRNSEIAALIETPTPSDAPLGPVRGMAVRPAQPAANGQPAIPAQNVTYEQVYGGGGKIPVLRPGEKFASYAHQHPSPTIEQWAKFIIRGIAVGYGIPFEVFWDPEAIGGANTRMITALLRARLQQRRAALIFPKLTRARFWILSRGIKRGELKWNPDLFACDWNPNFSDITVDAGRESRERRANVLAGLDTFTAYYSENGASYSDQVPIRQAEVELQCAAAEAITEKFPWLTPAAALDRIVLLTSNPSPNAVDASANADATRTGASQTP